MMVDLGEVDFYFIFFMVFKEEIVVQDSLYYYGGSLVYLRGESGIVRYMEFLGLFQSFFYFLCSEDIELR